MMILHVLSRTEIPCADDAGDDHHWVYRVYDCADRLLYVGSTRDVVARFHVHAASWHNAVSAAVNVYGTRIEVSAPIIGEAAARDAERSAIRAEAPLLNKLHNLGRSALRDATTWQAAEAELRAAQSTARAVA